MNLDEMTEPIRTRMESNTRAIFAIAKWIQENPNCRQDLRQDKLNLWSELNRENGRLMNRWENAHATWRHSCANARTAR